MKIAMIQMKIEATPSENIPKALHFLEQAKQMGADMAVLPEIFVCPYNNSCFPIFAMEQNDALLLQIAEKAKELGLFVVAGSVPERVGEEIFNSSFVFDQNGECIAKHRKTHLFDINIEGGQKFQESAVLSAGEDVTTFETPWGKLGLMICYDIRFPELARLLALAGAKGVIVPAAFNMTTGPAHWELTFRARALDNQYFMAGVAPARVEGASYVAWGHSISTDPWGRVLTQMDEKEGIALVEWDMEYVEKIRKELPLLQHRRLDVYRLDALK